MTSQRGRLGISLLYDTLLFAVMVSLSAAILLPAVCSPQAPLASLEKHRELEVDDALHSLLASRPETFSYAFCGTITDQVAGSLGVDTTSDGLYGQLRSWILANTPRHETYSSLLAEDLVCQLRVPLGPSGSIRLNVLTADFDASLKAALTAFFSTYFQGKYLYNLSAYWHPIKGLALGGNLSLGPPPPHQTSHVATRLIAVPIAPAIRIGNTTITLTRHGLAHYLNLINLSGNSTIPQIANIRTVLNAYLHHTPPYTSRPPAADAVSENLTSLLDGFLIDGIHTANRTLFPGIANTTLDRLFARITPALQNATNPLLNETFGDLTGTINRVLSGLNTSLAPLTTGLLTRFNTSLTGLLNLTCPSLPAVLSAAKTWALNQTRATAHQLLAPAIHAFTDALLNATDCLAAFTALLTTWLLDRLALQSATVTLTIWTMQP